MGVTCKTISSLFDIEAGVGITDLSDSDLSLWPEERYAVGGAVAKRVREFAAGRNAARVSLQKFGLEFGPIGMKPDRSPIWPQGVAGSISHCDGFCAAVTCRKSQGVHGIGFDVEVAGALSENASRLICTPQEVGQFNALPVIGKHDWATVAFSAKEAFYKAFFPHAGLFLDFLDVSISFEFDQDFLSRKYNITILRDTGQYSPFCLMGNGFCRMTLY